MKKKIEANMKKLTPRIIITFLYLQPFLDIIASFLIKKAIPNFISSFIRILFMIYMIFYLIIIKHEEKKKTLTYLTLLITCILIHTLSMYFYKGADIIFTELKTTLTTYYFIFLLISFITIFKEETLQKKHIRNIFYIYLILTFIPNILGIGFDSYWHSKLGSAGWFYSANVLGSILIILLPIVILEIKKLNIIYKIITLIIFLYVIFSLGTKTPVLGLVLIIFFNILYYIYKMIKQKEHKKILITLVVVITLTISSIIIVPKTSFYKNIKIHLDFIEKQGYEITSVEFLDNIIFSERLSMEKDARKIYLNSSNIEKLFGIGYIENYHKENQREKIIEMDYFDILYREGLIGFILYFMPTLYITFSIIKRIKLNEKTINWISVVIIIFALGFFQGHIFITPAISIYVALILTNSMKTEEHVV